MNKLILITLFSFFSLLAYSQKQSDNFSGKWKTEKGDIVDISLQGNSFVGKAGEKKKMVIDNLHFEQGKWVATLIKPTNGEKIPAVFSLVENKIIVLVSKGMFSKKMVWTKHS